MDNTKIHVGNISYNTTQEILEQAFGQFGTITDIFFPFDANLNRPRGFAFITMETAEQAQEAIKGMDGQEVDDRRITVSEARPRQPKPQFDRGGGNRGGGNGYSNSRPPFRRDDRGGQSHHSGDQDMADAA